MTFAKTFRRGDAVLATVGMRTYRGEYVRLGREGHLVTVVDDPQIEGARCYAVDAEHIRHAPVEIVGPMPTLPTTCPSCRSALTIDPAARKGVRTDYGTRYRTVRVAFCSGCEYAVEC